MFIKLRFLFFLFLCFWHLEYTIIVSLREFYLIYHLSHLITILLQLHIKFEDATSDFLRLCRLIGYLGIAVTLLIFVLLMRNHLISFLLELWRKL